MTVHGIDTLYWSPAAGPRHAGWPASEPGSGHELLRMREWPLRSHLELRAQPVSVRSARQHAAATLHEWRMEALADPVELLASKLVTNAVRASAERAAQIRFWLTSDRRSVLVQVWDGGHRHPVRQQSPPDAEAGRGLLIVEALSAQWGCYAPDRQGGKIVWAVCVGPLRPGRPHTTD
jgi:anti-sigma regulatory factor (Ser/Thr protein kinase)